MFSIFQGFTYGFGTFFTDDTDTCKDDYRTSYFGPAFEPKITGYDRNIVIKNPQTSQYTILEMAEEIQLCERYTVRRTNIEGLFLNMISDGKR